MCVERTPKMRHVQSDNKTHVILGRLLNLQMQYLWVIVLAISTVKDLLRVQWQLYFLPSVSLGFQ